MVQNLPFNLGPGGQRIEHRGHGAVGQRQPLPVAGEFPVVLGRQPGQLLEIVGR